MTVRTNLAPCAAIAAFAILLGATADHARAADVQSFKAKTKAVEIDIAIDQALLAEPKLGRRLRQEAERDLERWKRQAAAERRENPEFFTGGRFWSFDKAQSEAFRNDRFVSVLTTLSTYTGGAHGNVGFEALNWDRKTGRPFGIKDILAEAAKDGPAMTALAAGLRRGVAADKKERGIEVDAAETESIATALPADPDQLPPFTLEPSTEAGKASGLTFHIGPYRVGSYAEGSFEGFVPWGDVADHLKPDWRAVFGGERKPE